MLLSLALTKLCEGCKVYPRFLLADAFSYTASVTLATGPLSCQCLPWTHAPWRDAFSSPVSCLLIRTFLLTASARGACSTTFKCPSVIFCFSYVSCERSHFSSGIIGVWHTLPVNPVWRFKELHKVTSPLRPSFDVSRSFCLLDCHLQASDFIYTVSFISIADGHSLPLCLAYVSFLPCWYACSIPECAYVSFSSSLTGTVLPPTVF